MRFRPALVFSVVVAVASCSRQTASDRGVDESQRKGIQIDVRIKSRDQSWVRLEVVLSNRTLKDWFIWSDPLNGDPSTPLIYHESKTGTGWLSFGDFSIGEDGIEIPIVTTGALSSDPIRLAAGESRLLSDAIPIRVANEKKAMRWRALLSNDASMTEPFEEVVSNVVEVGAK